MRSRPYIARAVAIAAIVGATAGGARGDMHPLSLPLPWQPVAAEAGLGAPGDRLGGRPEILAQWGALPPVPPEQRQQMRQQMREHWQQMPPEQREGRRLEGRERWQSMPSEERQRIREEMRERGGQGGEGRHRDRR